jgi:hypothetical protein
MRLVRNAGSSLSTAHLLNCSTALPDEIGAARQPTWLVSSYAFLGVLCAFAVKICKRKIRENLRNPRNPWIKNAITPCFFAP